MQRRDFVKNTAILALGISLEFAIIKKWYDDEKRGDTACNPAGVSDALEADIQELLKWLKANGWTAHLHNTLGIDLESSDKQWQNILLKKINNSKLTTLRNDDKSGYDDFTGERLIQPGFPAYSLLYHTLASPRVRPQGVKEYPTLAQIDLLEDYIYALSNWEDLKALYKIEGNEELVYAVFAYEYRPAFKTPHHAYADMVYSRTGIARIGDQPLHYDRLNRCHSTAPADSDNKKQVAVMPARYGLYIARKVKNKNISLVTTLPYKGDDSKDSRNDTSKVFLQPIRKVFNNDLLTTGSNDIRFSEKHKSEKLQKLLDEGYELFENRKPEPRNSKDLIVQDDAKRRAGSSFLVISQPEALIRIARSGGKILYLDIPAHKKEEYDNRYFTAFCTQEVEDVELLEEKDGEVGRGYNKYPKPRNKPLFVNITHKKENNRDTFAHIPYKGDATFEEQIENKYYAPLFEDSICDGRVDASITWQLKGIGNKCLPAFSVVTAPDFFPQVDPIDLVAFDVAPGTSDESNFYEGGVASLATARIRPNPKMINGADDHAADTYLAVLSGPVKEHTGISPQRMRMYKNPASDRGYDISGFLPDVASSVFAPGWDVTYCSLDNIHAIYVGTEGLGSPFVEDMKFCSALNGMWPATSPDAARTYQGGGEKHYRNPTAVPLLDKEIGICGNGPAGKTRENWGWDGEQGPYLEKQGNQWKVNFTDLGRADAVDNALQGLLDMSQLRHLKSNELIARMQCLKLCINTLPPKNFYPEKYSSKEIAYTYLWLVSAEKVNWGNEDAEALGIPANLAGNDKKWITDKANARVKGEGYLYLFANSESDFLDKADEDGDPVPKPRVWDKTNYKRRWLNCDDIYVCQVTHNPLAIAWATIKDGKADWHKK